MLGMKLICLGFLSLFLGVKGDLMHFGSWVNQQENYYDSVHFPQSLQFFPFRGKGVYLVKGKVVEEFGYPSVEVHKMHKLEIEIAPKAGD